MNALLNVVSWLVILSSWEVGTPSYSYASIYSISAETAGVIPTPCFADVVIAPMNPCFSAKAERYC